MISIKYTFSILFLLYYSIHNQNTGFQILHLNNQQLLDQILELNFQQAFCNQVLQQL